MKPKKQRSGNSLSTRIILTGLFLAPLLVLTTDSLRNYGPIGRYPAQSISKSDQLAAILEKLNAQEEAILAGQIAQIFGSEATQSLLQALFESKSTEDRAKALTRLFTLSAIESLSNAANIPEDLQIEEKLRLLSQIEEIIGQALNTASGQESVRKLFQGVQEGLMPRDALLRLTQEESKSLIRGFSTLTRNKKLNRETQAAYRRLTQQIPSWSGVAIQASRTLKSAPFGQLLEQTPVTAFESRIKGGVESTLRQFRSAEPSEMNSAASLANKIQALSFSQAPSLLPHLNEPISAHYSALLKRVDADAGNSFKLLLETANQGLADVAHVAEVWTISKAALNDAFSPLFQKSLHDLSLNDIQQGVRAGQTISYALGALGFPKEADAAIKATQTIATTIRTYHDIQEKAQTLKTTYDRFAKSGIFTPSGIASLSAGLATGTEFLQLGTMLLGGNGPFGSNPNAQVLEALDGLNKKIDALSERIDVRFDRVDERLELLSKQMSQGFEKLNTQLSQQRESLNKLSKQLGLISNQVSQANGKLDTLLKEGRFQQLSKYFSDHAAYYERCLGIPEEDSAPGSGISDLNLDLTTFKDCVEFFSVVQTTTVLGDPLLATRSPERQDFSEALELKGRNPSARFLPFVEARARQMLYGDSNLKNEPQLYRTNVELLSESISALHQLAFQDPGKLRELPNFPTQLENLRSKVKNIQSKWQSFTFKYSDKKGTGKKLNPKLFEDAFREYVRSWLSTSELLATIYKSLNSTGSSANFATGYQPSKNTATGMPQEWENLFSQQTKKDFIAKLSFGTAPFLIPSCYPLEGNGFEATAPTNLDAFKSVLGASLPNAFLGLYDITPGAFLSFCWYPARILTQASPQPVDLNQRGIGGFARYSPLGFALRVKINSNDGTSPSSIDLIRIVNARIGDDMWNNIPSGPNVNMPTLAQTFLPIAQYNETLAAPHQYPRGDNEVMNLLYRERGYDSRYFRVHEMQLSNGGIGADPNIVEAGFTDEGLRCHDSIKNRNGLKRILALWNLLHEEIIKDTADINQVVYQYRNDAGCGAFSLQAKAPAHKAAPLLIKWTSSPQETLVVRHEKQNYWKTCFKGMTSYSDETDNTLGIKCDIVLPEEVRMGSIARELNRLNTNRFVLSEAYHWGLAGPSKTLPSLHAVFESSMKLTPTSSDLALDPADSSLLSGSVSDLEILKHFADPESGWSLADLCTGEHTQSGVDFHPQDLLRESFSNPGSESRLKAENFHRRIRAAACLLVDAHQSIQDQLNRPELPMFSDTTHPILIQSLQKLDQIEVLLTDGTTKLSSLSRSQLLARSNLPDLFKTFRGHSQKHLKIIKQQR